MAGTDERVSRSLREWDEAEQRRRPERLERAGRGFTHAVLMRTARAEAAEGFRPVGPGNRAAHGVWSWLAGDLRAVAWMIIATPVFWAMASTPRAAVVAGLFAIAAGTLVERAWVAREGKES